MVEDLLRNAVAGTADPEGGYSRLRAIVDADPSLVEQPEILIRVAAVAGASRALANGMATHPRIIHGASSPDSVPIRLRALLVPIVADDLLGHIDVEESTRLFSDGIDRLTVDLLDRARSAVAIRHPLAAELPFAVIAMGKWGARELNYYSDIDLVFVHEPPNGAETEARTTAIAIASRLMADLSSPTFEGTAIHVDADLRPEGTVGPLSRSLDSYRAYYDRWGEAWELQALLKARPVAGDSELGSRFREMADHFIWEQGLDVEALRSIRLLKARAEAEAPPRDIKRAPGGIRDVEFAVQVLQLVHGRFDPDLRVPATRDAINPLGAHGDI